MSDGNLTDWIQIKNARVHNLKGIYTKIPRDSLTVLTGPSGSGKSSLAFDTLYAEGQRRYVESLSVYARQFIDQLEKPEVDSIEGLSPAISIEQKTTSYNPRSTVGTVTEIYDYLRVFFARVSKPFCYSCGKPIRSQTQQQIVDQLLDYPNLSKISILAPIIQGRKGEYRKELFELRQKGFIRALIDGQVYDLSDDDIALDKNKKHDISVYIDRIILKKEQPGLETRISEAVENAFKLASGSLFVELQKPDEKKPQLILFSEKFACVECGINFPNPEPRIFSFNSPAGACDSCSGLGALQFKPELEDSSPLEEESDLDIELTENPVCPVCLGNRLKKESLSFKIANKNISDVCNLSISECTHFFSTLSLTARETQISGRLLVELKERLGFLAQVGVGYLSLDRSAQTLSGGEAQRIRLASQIGSSLVDVIYVLDEPSIGLHQRDNQKLIETLLRLRDMGNTVVVVEHDLDTMLRSDWILDFGPGAGVQGGTIVAEGSLQDIIHHKKSMTGAYLRGDEKIAIPKKRRSPVPGKSIRIRGASLNNLKNVSVEFPLGTLTCVTGVSGSGKSSLVMETLQGSLLKALYGTRIKDLKVQSVEGLELVDKAIHINQRAIGRTPRSNPATYSGLFSLVRDLFAGLPASKVRGYTPGRFSFNVAGGRCDICEGYGMTKVQMYFMPDVFVRCESCKGDRYNRETLQILYKGKNIAECLRLPIRDALEFFEAVPSIKTKLQTLNEVGLGYLELGQSATTLSGGESQRLKLAKELSRRSTGKTVYILDEPSTGLHFDDIKKLLSILQLLVDQGNTVIVIEHNLDIIKVADHVIDIGPEGGSLGGHVVCVGSPETVAKNTASYTGAFLKKIIGPSQ